jgi:hypothetical protein
VIELFRPDVDAKMTHMRRAGSAESASRFFQSGCLHVSCMWRQIKQALRGTRGYRNRKLGVLVNCSRKIQIRRNPPNSSRAKKRDGARSGPVTGTTKMDPTSSVDMGTPITSKLGI